MTNDISEVNGRGHMIISYQITKTELNFEAEIRLMSYETILNFEAEIRLMSYETISNFFLLKPQAELMNLPLPPYVELKDRLLVTYSA